MSNLKIETSRKSALATKTALATLATVSGLAIALFLGTESIAQAPPKCGQDPQHPCPKQAPQQPQQKAQPQQPQQPQSKQQAQPQPPAAQPQLKQQAQPQPNVPQQGQPQQKQFERKGLPQNPAVGQQPQQQQQQPVQQAQPQPNVPQQGQPQQKQFERKGPPQNPAVGQQPPVQQQQPVQQAQPQPNVPQQGQPQQKQFERKGLPQNPAVGQQPPVQQQQPVQQGQQRPPVPGQPQGAQTFQRVVRPAPGQPGQPGQPGAAPAFVNVQDLRNQRHERTEANGRVVIEEPDHRMIVREGNQAFVRHDENERLFLFGQGRTERRGNEIFSTVVRPDGFEIVTVTDPDGRLIRRFRRDRDGREIVFIDNRGPRDAPIFLNLAPPVIGIPRDQYIVDMAVAPEPFIYQTLMAPPLVPIERPYSLDEIRYNVELRDRMRRIDVDTINFEFGSWEVEPDEVGRLQLIAQAIQQIISRNPAEVFLIEGHTDAVGSDVDNLSLSDRRAETVADILTENFQIPPENLTTQGYGAHYLKIQTPDANRQNRRVTVRRITPLLAGRG